MFQQTRKINLLTIGVVITLLLQACGEAGVIVNQNKAIAGNEWNSTDTVSFNFKINDTVNYYDFSVLIRNTENYQWSNLFLFSDLTFPNGKTRRDTIEIQLADQYGYWLGNNSGTIVTTTSNVMQHRRFPIAGQYKLSFTHGMRADKLMEVSDIGIKLKKWQEN